MIRKYCIIGSHNITEYWIFNLWMSSCVYVLFILLQSLRCLHLKVPHKLCCVTSYSIAINLQALNFYFLSFGIEQRNLGNIKETGQDKLPWLFISLWRELPQNRKDVSHLSFPASLTVLGLGKSFSKTFPQKILVTK